VDMYTVALGIDPTGMVSGAAKSEAALSGVGRTALATEKVVKSAADIMSSALGKLGAAFALGAVLKKFVDETSEAQTRMA
jgi:hypothetical protein